MSNDQKFPSADAGVVQVASSVTDLQQRVRDGQKLLPVGRQTKAPLAAFAVDYQAISLNTLSGIQEYEPSEYTFTALAGTPLSEIVAALASQRQYLPFDPVLIDQGATLGGTVGSGINGPGRQRYGGLRDFILGAEIVTGDGHLVSTGGKVVKNAAGFDVPKLMVGSCGRLGILTSLTFKVFPAPPFQLSGGVVCQNVQDACQVIAQLAAGRWELDAIDFDPQAMMVYFRLAGPEAACLQLAANLQQHLGREVAMLPELDHWSQIAQLRCFSSSHSLVARLPADLSLIKHLHQFAQQHADEFAYRVSVAGALAWLSFSHGVLAEFQAFLSQHQAAALVIRQEGGDRVTQPLLGARQVSTSQQSVQQAIKLAMDPTQAFPPLLDFVPIAAQ
ncbi:MAG: hypothetical protein CBB71_10830 [Rhodopirellula sp. TMED11]|nr:MAG: hypothetical protein CBB71_10830 [Rhodopirellula sp. TMED11]